MFMIRVHARMSIALSQALCLLPLSESNHGHMLATQMPGQDYEAQTWSRVTAGTNLAASFAERPHWGEPSTQAPCCSGSSSWPQTQSLPALLCKPDHALISQCSRMKASSYTQLHQLIRVCREHETGQRDRHHMQLGKYEQQMSRSDCAAMVSGKHTCEPD